MNDRLAMAVAVAGGYVLGRTRKAKLALGVGTLALGKRFGQGPRALARSATARFAENPQLKEMGEQLRSDLRGTGEAATGALVNRQVNALADRLHERALDIRDQLAEAAGPEKGPAADSADDATADDAIKERTTEDADAADAATEDAASTDSAEGTARSAVGKTARRAPAKKPAASSTSSSRSSASPASKRSRPKSTAKPASGSKSKSAARSTSGSKSSATAKPRSRTAKAGGSKEGRSSG
ncbi:DNA primase [Streptomyces smyrnaeus]|uniref:DNA primase n=1 Tax=Streptomyces smyrnaeus TaxID=1387713 RepID=UPI0036CC82D1